jgi:hypothetical protein
MTTAKRELSLSNPVSEFDASDGDRSVRERLESGHRCAASLNRSVTLLDEVIEVPARPHLHISPARMLASQQPKRATTRRVSVER